MPVFKDVDRKGVEELSKELGALSKKARDGKLAPADMQGGTFTISSLGGIGGTDFTPIVNAPEVAILGVVRSKMAPVWDGKEFQPRLMQPLYVSYDHRVIDGALAARFTRHLCHVLEDVRRLVGTQELPLAEHAVPARSADTVLDTRRQAIDLTVRPPFVQTPPATLHIPLELTVTIATPSPTQSAATVSGTPGWLTWQSCLTNHDCLGGTRKTKSLASSMLPPDNQPRRMICTSLESVVSAPTYGTATVHIPEDHCIGRLRTSVQN